MKLKKLNDKQDFIRAIRERTNCSLERNFFK